MSLSIAVSINGETIGTVEVENRTRLTRPDDVNTYAWHYTGDAHRVLSDTLTHRYGDSAIVLASKVLTEIARRYEVAAAAGVCRSNRHELTDEGDTR